MAQTTMSNAEAGTTGLSGFERVKRGAGLPQSHPPDYCMHYLTHSTLNAHHMVRFLRVSQLCRRYREKRKLTLRKIAAELNVHFYELHVIETCALKEINGEILKQYIAFLGIENEFKKWSEDNHVIVKALRCD